MPKRSACTDGSDEAARLEALRETALMDGPSEEAFDRLTRMAARLLDVPVSLVSLVDDTRQFFKSCIGLPQPWAVLRQTPLSHSFCQHAVASKSPLIIDDARNHPLVRNNPAVVDLNVISYAGVPLLTVNGQALGSFCVIDSKPRHWTDQEIAVLRDLAAMVMSEIESRLGRRAEILTRRALEESDQRLRIALETARLGSWELDLTTGSLDCAPLCKANFGVSADSQLSWSALIELIHPDDRAAMQAAVNQALEDRTIYESEYRVNLPDGSTRWILASGRGIYDDAGKPIRMTGVTMDVTARKEAEEQRARLLEAERHARAEAEKHGRMKDEFLAILSHELRTPLNAILGWATVLRSGPADEDDLAQGLEAIERNARAQTQLIGDLLDMSRIISGKIRLEPQPVDLVGVIGSSIETVRPLANAREVQLRTALDVPGAVVRGDPDRLQQVLCNLLTTAIKFTQAEGTVRVVLTREGKSACVRVIDTGEGIDKDFLPYVFARFRQGDPATSRKYGGLGLGLAIVRHLVELHGGAVAAHSDGLGAGATFTVTLPLSDARRTHHDSRHRPGSMAPLPTRLDRVRVLVVDDEPDARQLVRRVLEGAEAHVTTAASANEAIRALEAAGFDLLICDLGMPEVDGYALIQKLRQEGPHAAIPAVALTAYARGEEQTRALECGFQLHIAKPFEPADLLKAVSNLTRKAQNS